MPADRSLSVRISSSPAAHRRRAFPANQLRLGTSLTPSLYAGLGENRPMDLIDLLLGRPLATEEEKAERIGPAKGIPIFGLDALSSAAYGPEAALTLLIPLGMAGVAYIVPISISIIFLLAIVYFSYRQTIMAYPQGGGSYTVASENLGVWPGLLAAASLMVDYVLTAAVGISAGVGALISAMPSLEKHTLALCLAILIVVTLVNLRGVSEAGAIFRVPTYLGSERESVKYPIWRGLERLRPAAGCRLARQSLYSEPQIQRWRPVLWGRTFHASRRSWKESSHPIDSSWVGSPERPIAGTLGGTGIPHRVFWLGRSVSTQAAGIPRLPNGENRSIPRRLKNPECCHQTRPLSPKTLRPGRPSLASQSTRTKPFKPEPNERTSPYSFLRRALFRNNDWQETGRGGDRPYRLCIRPRSPGWESADLWRARRHQQLRTPSTCESGVIMDRSSDSFCGGGRAYCRVHSTVVVEHTCRPAYRLRTCLLY